MKPKNGLLPFSIWLFRIGIVMYALTTYKDVFLLFNFKSIMFYVASINIIGSLLLFIGGFFRKSNLTVLSALFLIICTGYQAFFILHISLSNNYTYLIVLGGIFFYFLAVGNKNVIESAN